MRTLPARFSAPTPTASASPASVPPPAVNSPPRLPMSGPIGQGWPGRELLDDPMLARVLLAAWGGDAAVVVKACPGAGKSRLALNKLGSAAIIVRREFITKLLTRKTAPKGAVGFVADALARDAYMLTGLHADDTAAELLGLKENQQVRTLTKGLDARTGVSLVAATEPASPIGPDAADAAGAQDHC